MSPQISTTNPDIADYDQGGYDYTSYWQDRQYEDQSERLAIKKLLPKNGESLIDLGGGFGRLTPLYAVRFTRCVLFDYSQNNLTQAQIRFEQTDIQNVKTLKGNLYHLPFPDESFSVALLVRVIHHLKQPEIVLKEVERVLKEDGLFILEFPNQIHLKARLKALLKADLDFTKNQRPQQKSSQNGIFYNYHPAYIQNLLQKNNLRILRKISVSNLRLASLKKVFPLRILLLLESLLQTISALSLSHFYLGPSIFLLCRKEKPQKT